MLQPNPTLSVFRDIVVIAGVLVLCLLGFQDFSVQAQARRDQQVRFQVVGQAITQLDTIYAKQMAGVTDINTIVLKQNQLLLEYQKLLLTTEYLPAAAVKMNQPAPAKPGQPGQPVQPGQAGQPNQSPQPQSAQPPAASGQQPAPPKSGQSQPLSQPVSPEASGKAK